MPTIPVRKVVFETREVSSVVKNDLIFVRDGDKIIISINTNKYGIPEEREGLLQIVYDLITDDLNLDDIVDEVNNT